MRQPKGTVVDREFNETERGVFNGLYEASAKEVLKLARIHELAGAAGKMPSTTLRQFIDATAHNLACLAIWNERSRKAEARKLGVS